MLFFKKLLIFLVLFPFVLYPFFWVYYILHPEKEPGLLPVSIASLFLFCFLLPIVHKLHTR